MTNPTAPAPAPPRTANQINLIAAISKELDRQGFASIETRQWTAMIDAANLICDELNKPHRPAGPGVGLSAWLDSDVTGLSSRAMARRLAPLAGDHTPVVVSRLAIDENEPEPYPRDASDFGRCVGLLDACPELRAHLPAMAEASPLWAAIIAEWGELEGLYRAGLVVGKAPKLSKRLAEISERAWKEGREGKEGVAT